MRTELGGQAYVQDLEDHLQLNLFGSGAADPESAVRLVRGAMARGDQARAGDLAEETAKLAAGNPGDIDLAAAAVHAAGLVGRDPAALDQGAGWYFAPVAPGLGGGGRRARLGGTGQPGRGGGAAAGGPRPVRGARGHRRDGAGPGPAAD